MQKSKKRSKNCKEENTVKSSFNYKYRREEKRMICLQIGQTAVKIKPVAFVFSCFIFSLFLFGVPKVKANQLLKPLKNTQKNKAQPYKNNQKLKNTKS